jgi:hypothetical protein
MHWSGVQMRPELLPSGHASPITNVEAKWPFPPPYPLRQFYGP